MSALPVEDLRKNSFFDLAGANPPLAAAFNILADKVDTLAKVISGSSEMSQPGYKYMYEKLNFLSTAVRPRWWSLPPENEGMEVAQLYSLCFSMRGAILGFDGLGLEFRSFLAAVENGTIPMPERPKLTQADGRPLLFNDLCDAISELGHRCFYMFALVRVCRPAELETNIRQRVATLIDFSNAAQIAVDQITTIARNWTPAA